MALAAPCEAKAGHSGWKRWTVVLGALASASLLVMAGPRWHVWSGRAGGQRAGGIDSLYQYRFQRMPKGSVRRALQGEIEFYQARISRNPDGGLDLASLAGTYLTMARATGDLSWYLLAEQAARHSLANLPFHNTRAILVLARVVEARHDFDEAIHLAQQAGRNDDALSIIVTSNLAMGKVGEARRAAEALVDRAPSLGSYTLRALVEIAQGKDEEAVADFQRALAAEEVGEAGSSAWARTLLGRLYYKQGRLAEAAELYREALRILPQYPLALVNLAELEIRSGHYKAAEQHLTQVVTITRASPNIYDHVVLRGLARIKELQGDLSRARGFWDDAEARLRQDVTSGKFGHRRELARLLLERGRPQDVPEALSLMEAEMRVRRDADTLDVSAWALSRAHRWRDARHTIREALASGVRDAKLFYRAGVIEQTLGNRGQAQQFFRTARQTDPTFDEHARRVVGLGY